MGEVFDNVATAIGAKVAAFVIAADDLVNLLAATPQPGEPATIKHQASVELAYDRYDRARRELTGDDVSSA